MGNKNHERFPWKGLIKLSLAVIDIFTAGLVINIYHIQRQYNNHFEEEIQNVNSQFQISQDKINAEIDSIKQMYISSNIEENTTINNINSMFNENTSAITLLAYAEKAFIVEDYKSVVQVYCMPQLQDNGIACNNMGYMFATGIYYPIDQEQADKYFDKAIEAGCEKAYENKLKIHLKNYDNDIIELLKQGYEMENMKTKVVEFIACQMEDYETYTQEQKDSIAWQFLYKISKESQKELLETFYRWVADEEYVQFYNSPSNTETVKYIWIDDNNVTIDGSHMTIHIYEKFIKECSGIDMWVEGLFFVN